ncbi:hypothetical protein ACI7RC_00985 [Brevibacillus sp. B_LB10_24]|uniref:hypothetical protein n=1 Tax=Brevibacillus sp. B_LB10_24 TaxID=3380645 RepID=UPI0038B8EB45
MKAISTLLIPLTLLVLTGCSASSDAVRQPIDIQPPEPPLIRDQMNETAAGPKQDTPFDYASMTDEVLIQLNSEPRLHSPIRTLVSDGPQEYTLYFRQPMQRDSVEKTLQERAKDFQKDWPYSFVPELAFAWKNDQELLVTAEVPASKPRQISDSYLLDVKGAQTQNGTVLDEQPNFFATVTKPDQLWRISLDGKVRERLSSLSEPYMFEQLGMDDRYFFLSRFKEYCECDKELERLYGLYDVEKKQLISYPVPLATNYMGPGTFIADRRGFFYKQPDEQTVVPESQTAVPVRVDGHIYGSSFSRDGSHLLLAVGEEQQQANLDLVVYALENGTFERLSGALKGNVPPNELSGNPLPIYFYDDGEYVYFAMRDPDKQAELRYMYSWQTKQISTWNSPVDEDAWSGFSSSSDGKYKMYPNAGLYKGKELVYQDINVPGNYWINGTHLMVGHKYEDVPDGVAPQESITLFDADTQKRWAIMEHLPGGNWVIGSSADGKWIYLTSKSDLASLQ